MRINRRGVTLVELVFAMGLGLVVLAVGYRAYSGVMRVQDVESRREDITLTAQSLMSRIKSDTRSASSASASHGALALNGAGGQIDYKSLPSGAGVERSTRYGRGVFRGVSAEFSSAAGGVNVRVSSKSVVRRRPIGVEIRSIVFPRNR